MSASYHPLDEYGRPIDNTNPEAKLMGIPTKIRSQILSHILPRTTIKLLEHRIAHKKSDDPAGPFPIATFSVYEQDRLEREARQEKEARQETEDGPEKEDRSETAVLRTCTELRREGLEFLYKDMTLEVPLHSDRCIQWFDQSPEAWSSEATEVRVHLRDFVDQSCDRPVICSMPKAREVLEYRPGYRRTWEVQPKDGDERCMWMAFELRRHSLYSEPNFLSFMGSSSWQTDAILDREALVQVMTPRAVVSPRCPVIASFLADAYSIVSW